MKDRVRGITYLFGRSPWPSPQDVKRSSWTVLKRQGRNERSDVSPVGGWTMRQQLEDFLSVSNFLSPNSKQDQSAGIAMPASDLCSSPFWGSILWGTGGFWWHWGLCLVGSCGNAAELTLLENDGLDHANNNLGNGHMEQYGASWERTKRFCRSIANRENNDYHWTKGSGY